MFAFGRKIAQIFTKLVLFDRRLLIQLILRNKVRFTSKVTQNGGENKGFSAAIPPSASRLESLMSTLRSFLLTQPRLSCVVPAGRWASGGRAAGPAEEGSRRGESAVSGGAARAA